jgi:hypothetical protein
MSKMGFSTRWGFPSDHGICNWYGCDKSIVKGTCFCEEHGKIEVNVTLVEDKPTKKLPEENKGYKKVYEN